MKVYVDKLPKSCNDCKFKVFIAYTKNGWEHSERYCSIMKESYDCSCSEERCPLKSLAEYKKQVVKEVCEEIREELEPKNANHIDELINELTEQTILISKGFKACKERVFNKLDQIQENINKE